MMKALLLLEFRRLFPSTAVSLSAIAASIWGIEFLYASWWPKEAPAVSPEEVSRGLDGFLLGILVLSGFFSGRATFPAELKQRTFLFFQSIPLSRIKTWLVLCLAGGCSSLLSLCVALAIRPGAALMLLSSATTMGLILLLYSTFFTAGACVALLYRSAAVVLLSGLVGTALTLAAVFALSAVYISSPGETRGLRFPINGGSSFPVLYFTVCTVSVIGLYLGLSCRFFVAGEFHLFGLRIKKNVTLVAAEMLLLIAWMALQETDTWALGQRWHLTSPYFGFSNLSSRDGKFLALLEERTRMRQWTRISILDPHSGSISARVNQRGVLDVFWSNKINLLGVVVADDAPLWRLGYLLPPSDLFLWLEPDGRIKERVRFSSASILQTLPAGGGRTMVLVQRGDVIELFENRDGTTETRALASTRLPRGFSRAGGFISRIGRRHLVTCPGAVAWVVDEKVQELQIPGKDPQNPGVPFIVEGVNFPTRSKARDRVAQLFPFHGPPNASAKTKIREDFILPLFPEFFDRLTTVFYVRASPESDTSELWVLNKKAGTWKLLTDDMPIGYSSLPSSEEKDSSLGPSGAVLPNDGIALYPVQTDAGAQWYLYDDQRGSSLPLGTPLRDSASGWIQPSSDGNIFLATIRKESRSPVRQELLGMFSYVRERGMPLPVSNIEDGLQIISLSREGAVAGQDIGKDEVYWISGNGIRKRIWPRQD